MAQSVTSVPPTQKSEKKETGKRLSALQSVVLIVVGVLLFELFNRSVVVHTTTLALARNQQLTKQEVEPKRGTIYASTVDGHFPLATTDEKFTISVVPKNIKDKAGTAKTLAEILGQDQKDIFDKINNNKAYLPALVKRIDKDPAQRISDKNLAGVIVTPEYVRYYPEGSLASHVLGFVNYDNKGNYGVEGYYNDELKGLSGSVVAEKDNKGRFISILNNQGAVQNGDTLVLTIDQNVQYMAEQKLKEAIDKYGATGGQIAIIDVKTGAVTAMASQPSFDPNKFNEVKAEDQTSFNNPVISETYEPGSIMKPLVVAMGIDSGKMSATDEGDYQASVTVQGYDIHTATKKAFGHETVTQVLENSDNVAMVSFAEKIGTDIMFDYFQKLGMGAKFGIDSNGETSGKLLEKKNWRDINRATISFGQGISVTPLQMLMGYQALGNDGMLVAPHLVSQIIHPDGSEVNIATKQLRQVFKPDTTEQVRRMLVAVVTNGHGKKAAVPGYVIGGKTGTAQIPNKDKSGYEENSHIGSFAGLVPADNPRFAMLVKLDRPSAVEFAESSAAPTFGEVAQFLLQYYQIPKTTP